MILNLILLIAVSAGLFALVVKGVFVVSDYLLKPNDRSVTAKRTQSRYLHSPTTSVTRSHQNPIIDFSQVDHSTDNFTENRSVFLNGFWC